MIEIITTFFIRIRMIAEFLYFLSGIVVAFCAIKGLKQISLMKHESYIRTKREALQIATQIISDININIIPSYENLQNKLASLEIEIFKMEANLFKDITSKEKGRFQIYYDSLSDDLQYEIKLILVRLENVASNLSNGIADNDYGFEQIGTKFCVIIQSLSPIIYHDKNDYSSLIKLFDSWNGKITRGSLQDELNKLMAKIQALNTDPIETIGLHTTDGKKS